MKFTLTIEGNTDDKQSVSVLALIASIAEGTVPNIPLFTAAPGTDDDDDNAAPAVAGDPNERDANGLPWDERIHSKSRAKIAGNVWRKRKGVQADLVTSVEAELRARANPTPPVAPVAPVTPPPSAPATTPVNTAPPPSTIGTPAPSIASPSETPPAAPPATPPAAPAVAGAPTDFGAFMEIFSKSMGAKLIDGEGQFLAWLCSQPDVAVGQITEIAASPAKITAAYNHLVAQNRIAP